MNSHWRLSGIKVIGALLKQNPVAVVTQIRKEIHVPNTRSQDRNITSLYWNCTISLIHILKTWWYTNINTNYMYLLVTTGAGVSLMFPARCQHRLFSQTGKTIFNLLGNSLYHWVSAINIQYSIFIYQPVNRLPGKKHFSTGVDSKEKKRTGKQNNLDSWSICPVASPKWNSTPVGVQIDKMNFSSVAVKRLHTGAFLQQLAIWWVS